ncbi:MAG: peptide chain release factor N(5)-glutamine methyltransferase [Anaerolineales bacterium]|nr:peptide chain release factor N(5)-glutamine methyltransferase [Anaerolineales bacterium]
MQGIRTVGAVMKSARDRLQSISETAGMDTQLLLEHVTGRPREQLLAHPEQTLTLEQESSIETLVQQYLENRPLPYLLGWWEFYGRRFEVSPAVLIPRPETELLVEQALSFLRPGKPARILDVGTGSGIIAITLLLEHFPGTAVATDLSRKALVFAEKNRVFYSLQERLKLVQTDLASGCAGDFDLVCANLPYIPTTKLDNLLVSRREPLAALDGGEDGLDLIRRLLEDLPRLVCRGGAALFEIEADQRTQVLDVARWILSDCDCRILPDLAGRDRLLIVSGF